MGKMYILPNNPTGGMGFPLDISKLNYREVDMPVVPFDGPAYSDFTGAEVYASDYISEEDGYVNVIIPIKAGQTTTAISDCILIICVASGSISYSVFVDNKPKSNASTIYEDPWVFFQTSSGKYGVVARNNRDNVWGGFQFKTGDNSYVSAVYDLLPSANISDISIRCPDSVRQGLFIIVACDSPEQPYVDFTCTLSGHTSPMTKLMQNTDKTLRLQCGSDEGASKLLLEVESGGATASKAITVIPYTPVGPGTGDNEYDTTSRVTDISLLAFPDTVAPGGYSIILISVNGEGNYSQRITAEISGHTSADTQYFSDGYFCNIAVGKDETAESILVTITSAQDPGVSASVTVNVDHSGDTPVDPGTDEERLQRAFWKGFAAGIPG